MNKQDAKTVENMSSHTHNLTLAKMYIRPLSMRKKAELLARDSLPLSMLGGKLVFNTDCFSIRALRCLGMLAISRHGLSEVVLRHALAIFANDDVNEQKR